jgi:hypothetical protein
LSSESIREFDSDTEIEEIKDPSNITLVSSNSKYSSLGAKPEEVQFVHPRQLHEFFAREDDVPKILAFTPTIGSMSSPYLPRSLQALESAVINIPRSPKSNRARSLQYFLNFHKDRVTHAHYSLFYDYQSPIYILLEFFEPLQYSVAAFSALIRSFKVDQSSREQAFVYYAMALKELRVLLQRAPRDISEYHGIVATVLQLSTFDVTSLCEILLTIAISRRRCQVFSTCGRDGAYYAGIFESYAT